MRVGSWLMGGYRSCLAYLTVLFVRSIDLSFKHSLTHRTAIGFLVAVAIILPLFVLLSALGRRRGELYSSDSTVVTWVGVSVLAGTVLVLCIPAARIL
jgi:hypothetical protein